MVLGVLVFAFWLGEEGFEFAHEAEGANFAVENSVEMAAGDAEFLADLCL